MNVPSQGLVIDADIARACGTSGRPPAPQILATLDTILDIGHRALVSDELLEEWQRHAGKNKVFNRWLRQMFGRKRVVRFQLKDYSALVEKLITFGVTEEERFQISKDVHLLAAALQGDFRVLSQDERARRHYKTAAQAIAQLRIIVWVNPSRDEEAVLAWLEAGAPIEQHRLLGHDS